MYHSDLELKEGAFFISDAHYSSARPDFLNFLQSIQSKKLIPSQLIFMGDIFDALFGGVSKTSDINKEAISIINELSQRLEIIYLEGNHDFNLASLFPQVHIFPIAQQPLICSYKNQKVILAHGDFDGTFFYKLYTSIIRNRFFLKFLNIFDTYILKKLDLYLRKKDDCKKLDWFENYINKRVRNHYDCKYFIEGHFHQNVNLELGKIFYTNLGAFACNQRYFTVESSKDKFFLREDYFHKET